MIIAHRADVKELWQEFDQMEERALFAIGSFLNLLFNVKTHFCGLSSHSCLWAMLIGVLPIITILIPNNMQEETCPHTIEQRL